MAYPLWMQFIAEMLAMMVAITIGESLIANEVLARTKGHELGLGFVAIGFGGAFFVGIEMFGAISASCNPAMFLAKAISAKKDWQTALVGMVADFIGAFIGAIFVWLLYLAHFSLVPEPPQVQPSVTPEEAKTMEALKPLLDPLNAAPEYKRNSFISYTGRETEGRQMSLLYQGGDDLRQRGPRATLQGEEKEAVGRQASMVSNAGELMTRGTGVRASIQMTVTPVKKEDFGKESSTGLLTEASFKEDLEYAAYEAALIADQNAKLSVFATRPAIYHPLANWLCEFIGTIFLIWCALCIEERVFLFPDEGSEVYWKAFVEPFLVGWTVTALVMAMAGPTGYAANPARDMSPRIAHWLLPIPNKGPSEFHYSWVPFTASYAGGAVGGILFWLCRRMVVDAGGYPEWSLAAASRPLFGAWAF